MTSTNSTYWKRLRTPWQLHSPSPPRWMDRVIPAMSLARGDSVGQGAPSDCSMAAIKSFRVFARSISIEPSFLTLRNRTVIPYPSPRGSMREIKAGSVVAYGQKAVDVFLPETNQWNKLKNTARLRYLERHEDFLRSWRGFWVAVNPEGKFVVANTRCQTVGRFMFSLSGRRVFFSWCWM